MRSPPSDRGGGSPPLPTRRYSAATAVSQDESASFSPACTNVGLADEQDCGGIKRIPREAYTKGLCLAVTALAPMPDEEAIVDASEQFVPVSALRPTLADALLKLDQSGVAISPEARNAALQAVR